MSEAEVIEGEATEVEPRALAVVQDVGMAATGPLALASLTDEEFDRRLTALDTMRTRVARMQKALMVRDVDYGVIPGTGSKPTLLKPGAEKLAQAYGLAADFIPKRIVGNGVTEPHLSYVTRCELHLGSTDGLVVAVGHGSANSFERKHRYRRAERVCPNCGKAAIIKGKAEYGGGWVCFKKKDGCGAKWRDGAAEIEGQTVEDIENPDPFDLDVVLVKMSEKRSFIDATLRATAASGLFTQDIEDLPRIHEEPPEEYVSPRREDAPRRDEPDDASFTVQHGPDGLIGTVQVGKPPVDMETRQTPDGPAWGFKLAQGRKGFQALATGTLAEVLAISGLEEGTRVTVWGRVEEVDWYKGDKKMPPYLRVHIERLQTPEWTLPAEIPDEPNKPSLGPLGPENEAGPEGPVEAELPATETSGERPDAPSQPLFELDPEERAAVGGGLPG